jgi:hypothetical protein
MAAGVSSASWAAVREVAPTVDRSYPPPASEVPPTAG